MDVTQGHFVTPRRAALAAMAVGALVAVTACGTQVAGHGGLPGAARSGSHHTSAVSSMSASGALCAQASTLSEVVVTHTVGEPTGHLREAQPAAMTVRDAGAVRPLARTLCGLPQMKPGVIHCPMDTGSGYHLQFARPGHTFPPVVIDLTGCHGVTGLGKTRTWISTPSLAHTLTTAMSGHLTVTRT